MRAQPSHLWIAVCAGLLCACGSEADGLTDVNDSTSAALKRPRDFVIVAIGDSIASGEGNPLVPGKFDAFGGNGKPVETWGFADPLDPSNVDAARCHRSSNAWPARAAELVKRRAPNTRVRFVSFACSGALLSGKGVTESYEGIEPSDDVWMQPQVDQVNTWLRANGIDHIDALLVSAGANDAKFADVLAACVIPGLDCSKTRFFDLPGGRDNSLDAKMRAGLAGLAQGFDDLRAIVDEGLEPRHLDVHRTARGALQLDVMPDQVYVAEYPMATRDENGKLCDNDAGLFFPPQELLWHVTAKEAASAERDLVLPLNAAIARAGNEEPFVAITGIADAFFAHGFCAGPRRWFLTTQDARRIQGSDSASGFASSGMLHPNGAGHAAIANLVVAEHLGPQIERLAR